ncbi:MAG: glycosyltransferase family 2 protein [Nitrospirae bacterium]|jgi:glycosyltransferase involved in cell wall biosynthesis|nr:glycosyltransferase family 2 protein [Nitrospirota bacterium]MCL5062083.1 glycosyltransferase family 2 protein [Nitrospirota bacterium]MDA8338972.1 glycosyltransferase family 2 protein [Nitrospiraceae bacterium]
MAEFSVIIPAYNEGKTIFQNLMIVSETMETGNLDFEIILVDDGSSDDTFDEAKRAANSSQKIKVVHYEHNAGKGTAFKKGFENSSGKDIALLDADLDFHPSQLLKMLNVLQQTGADIVIGSKYHTESKVNYPFLRRIMSKGYAFLVKLLFKMPFRDTQSGIKVFKREILGSVLPYMTKSKGYAFDVEILLAAYKQGAQINEYPVILNFVKNKQGFPLKMVLNLFTETLRVRLKS